MAQMVVGLIRAENGNYGISFPDFPGAASAAKSADEAVARGRDTLVFHVRGMIDDGDELPVPRSLEELRKDRVSCADVKGAAIVMVPLDDPGRSLRVNISMDETSSTRLISPRELPAKTDRPTLPMPHAPGCSEVSERMRWLVVQESG
ncbi:MAG TPA: type II toxin-antitoxin system HicB family antitoxin [Rhizomicrobium sp.]|jgi:predicted RNase H-like HicB family nuclease|nr:type II toxin-antitoxin system HicB family antitoxin [Rhizomicrobium sp.]